MKSSKRRISACLKACGDIPTECLESGGFEDLIVAIFHAMMDVEVKAVFKSDLLNQYWYREAKKALSKIEHSIE